MNDRDCNAIFAMLSQYLDHELPAADCEQLERHIRACAPCIEFIESLKKSVKLCREFGPDVEPPPLTPAIKEALERAYRRNK